MMEGSGAGSVLVTNGYGRPKKGSGSVTLLETELQSLLDTKYFFSAALTGVFLYKLFLTFSSFSLQSKFPFAAWLLSLYFGEESPVVLDPAVTSHEAVKFKSAFLDDINNK